MDELSALPDPDLRRYLDEAMVRRTEAESEPLRSIAGRQCLAAIAELRRRGLPLPAAAARIEKQVDTSA